MQLKKYDLILKKNGKSPISKLIHFFTKDIYNHAELYLGNYIICDAMPNGVKIRTFDSSLKEFDAFRYTGTITSEQDAKIEEFIQKSINAKYDFLQLIFQALHINFGVSKKYICIELVIKAFEYAGLDVGEWKQGFKQITDTNFFEVVK
jgi:uncharacterized protein YycO